MKYYKKKFSTDTYFKTFLLKLIKINWIIVSCLILLGSFGVASLYSAAGGSWYPWAENHLIRLIFGFFLMFVIVFLPSNIIFKYSVLSFF